MTAATLSKTMLTSIPGQLVPMLKTLRLGGMQDTLPLRLDQAQQQRLGYLEFPGMRLGRSNYDGMLAPTQQVRCSWDPGRHR